ncbi:MAG: hypothetical protein INF91_11280, partial [Alphaproteobacteria bacterium]|nr:hypothetical protein [Alphaproteobacteria bacterium]
GDFTLSGANLANYNLPTGTVVGNIGTINPKALTAVLVGSITKVYDANTSATVGSANYSLSGFIGGDGATVSKTAATYDTANVGTGKTVTVSGLVSGEFTATGGALLSNYTLPTSATGAIGAITQKALTVAADNKSKTFGQTDPALTYTATGFVGGDTVALMTGALTRVTGENAGTYAINQGTLTAGGNYAITFTPGVFTINPAGVTLTYSIGNTTNVYGSLPTVGAVTLTGVQGADVVNPVVTVTNASNQAVTLATTTGVGTYTARVTSLTGANAGNYTITNSGSTAGTITVTPATLTVIADNKTKVFGQTDPALTFTGSGLKNSDTLASVLTGGLTRVAGENAGTYAINQGTLAANANYTVAFTPGVFTINPAGLLINFAVANTTNVYGTLPTVGAVTLTGVQGSDVVNPVISITNGANQPITLATNTGVGTYTATVTGLTGANAGNYSLSISGNTPGTITVTPATLTLTAASHIKTYGDDDPALTFTAAGFVAGDAPSLLTGGLGRQSGENVGVYGINSGTVAAGPNYVVRLAGTPTLTIEPAVLTLSVASATKVYGTSDPTPSFTLTGFKRTDTAALVTGSISRATGENVGSYAYNAGTLSAGGNYRIQVPASSGALSITPATLTWAIGDTTNVYGILPTVANVVLTGVVGNDQVGTTVAVSNNAGQPVALATNTPVGVYAARVAALTGSMASNYVLATTGNRAGSITVTPAALTLTINNASRFFGAPNPPFSGTLVGVAAGDSPSALLAALLLSSPANSTSPVGPYPITATGSLANYTLTVTPGILSVLEAPRTFEPVVAPGTSGASISATGFDRPGANATISALVTDPTGGAGTGGTDAAGATGDVGAAGVILDRKDSGNRFSVYIEIAPTESTAVAGAGSTEIQSGDNGARDLVATSSLDPRTSRRRRMTARSSGDARRSHPASPRSVDSDGAE